MKNRSWMFLKTYFFITLTTLIGCGESTLPLTAQNASGIALAVQGATLDSTADMIGNPGGAVDVLSTSKTKRSNRALKIAMTHIKTFAEEEMKAKGIFNSSSIDIKPLVADCPAISAGAETDVDDDGIPATITYAFNGCSLLEGFGTLQGTIAITDKDDNDAASGFSVTLTGVRWDWTSDSGTIDMDLSGSFDATVSGVNISIAYVYSVTYVITGAASAGSFSISMNNTINYTATNAATPWDAGTVAFDGSLTMTYGSDNGTIAFTGANLVYDNAECGSPGYTSGTVTVTSGGDSIVITASDNCIYTSTFNGTAL